MPSEATDTTEAPARLPGGRARFLDPLVEATTRP
jgi:hypothetical protein